MLIQGSEITIEWEVENTLDVEINNNIGKVLSKDKLTIKPTDNFEYIIKAIGFNDTIEKKLNIMVFPTPIIKSIQVPSPTIEKEMNIAINIPQFPNIELGINKIQSSLNIQFQPTINESNFTNQTPMFNELDDDFQFINKNTGFLSDIIGKIKYKNNEILRKIFNK